MVAQSRQSRESSILGKLCASFNGLVIEFPQINSKLETSFLRTSTTGLAHGLVDMYGSYI